MRSELLKETSLQETPLQIVRKAYLNASERIKADIERTASGGFPNDWLRGFVNQAMLVAGYWELVEPGELREYQQAREKVDRLREKSSKLAREYQGRDVPEDMRQELLEMLNVTGVEKPRND